MVTRCCVINCNTQSTAESKVSFFRFPAIKIQAGKMKKELLKRRREAWIRAVNRKNLNIEKLQSFRICDKHFASGKPAKLNEVDHPDWVPSLSMGYGRNIDNKIKSKLDRYVRLKKRETSPPTVKIGKAYKHIEVINLEPDAGTETAMAVESSSPNYVNQGSEAEPAISIIRTIQLPCSIESLVVEQQRLRDENANLKSQLALWNYSEESFRNRDDKVEFYTGLPNVQMINILLEYINSSLSAIMITNLNNFQKLVLTLMKFRSNASFQDLSYRFNIDECQVNYVFEKTVVLLANKIKNLIRWLDKETVVLKMPKSFKDKFGEKVRVIIDYFEITLEDPPSKKPKPQSISNDKTDQTLKYLIGVTPHGIISFISDSWGSGISDVYITEHCGILDKLSPGDVILADRGVLVHEANSKKQVPLDASSFTAEENNRNQEKPRQVESARVIHIDRLVIDCIKKKFRIMNDPAPIWLVKNKYQNRSLLDYVVRVCCILYNLLEVESVVTVEC